MADAVELDRADLQFNAPELRPERGRIQKRHAVANDLFEVQCRWLQLARAGKGQHVRDLVQVGIARIGDARRAHQVECPALHFGGVDDPEGDSVQRAASGNIFHLLVQFKS